MEEKQDRAQSYHEFLTPGMQELAAAGKRLEEAMKVAVENVRVQWAKFLNNWAASIEEKNRDSEERSSGSRPPEAEGGLD